MSGVCSVEMMILSLSAIALTRSGEPMTSCVSELGEIGEDCNSGGGLRGGDDGSDESGDDGTELYD